MNCPAKTEPIVPDGHNQSPNALSSDLTTRSDLGRVANARRQREHRLSDPQQTSDAEIIALPHLNNPPDDGDVKTGDGANDVADLRKEWVKDGLGHERDVVGGGSTARGGTRAPFWRRWPARVFHILRTYCKFVGPGFMISVVSSTSARGTALPVTSKIDSCNLYRPTSTQEIMPQT